MYLVSGFTVNNPAPCHASGTVTVVDVDSGEEERVDVSSKGSSSGLNLKDERIYFGGLPIVGNYR